MGPAGDLPAGPPAFAVPGRPRPTGARPTPPLSPAPGPAAVDSAPDRVSTNTAPDVEGIPLRTTSFVFEEASLGKAAVVIAIEPFDTLIRLYR